MTPNRNEQANGTHTETRCFDAVVCRLQKLERVRGQGIVSSPLYGELGCAAEANISQHWILFPFIDRYLSRKKIGRRPRSRRLL